MSFPDINYNPDFGDPAVVGIAVTPDDAVDLAEGATRALYVGTGGDLAVLFVRGNKVSTLLVGVPSGSIIPISVIRVGATNTTADNIVALY